MATEAKTILGISPGTRSMGLAIFRHGELADWRVKIFKGKWKETKLRYILSAIHKYAELHEVDLLVMKKPSAESKSKAHNTLLEEIQKYCKNNGIAFSSCTAWELKKMFFTDGKCTKKILVSAIVQKFPELANEYEKEKRNYNVYYEKMFEAVAIICRHSLR